MITDDRNERILKQGKKHTKFQFHQCLRLFKCTRYELQSVFVWKHLSLWWLFTWRATHWRSVLKPGVTWWTQSCALLIGSPRAHVDTTGRMLIQHAPWLGTPKQVITKSCWGSFTYVCVLQGSVQDKVKPLVFSLNASLYEKLPKKRNVVQDLSRLPVLSQKPRPIRTQVRH